MSRRLVSVRLTEGGTLRSIHPASYTRLYNSELPEMVQESAVDSQPPPQGVGDATGLYAGRTLYQGGQGGFDNRRTLRFRGYLDVSGPATRRAPARDFREARS